MFGRLLTRPALRRGVLAGSAAAAAATAWALASHSVSSYALADAAPAAPGLVCIAASNLQTPAYA